MRFCHWKIPLSWAVLEGPEICSLAPGLIPGRELGGGERSSLKERTGKAKGQVHLIQCSRIPKIRAGNKGGLKVAF